MFKLCKKSLLDVCFECGTPRSFRPAAAAASSSREGTLAVARDGHDVKFAAIDPLDAYTDAVVSETAVKWKTASGLTKRPPGRPRPARLVVEPPPSVSEESSNLCDGDYEDPDRVIAHLRLCADGRRAATGTALVRSMRTLAKSGRVDGLAVIEALDAAGQRLGVDGSALRMSVAEAHWANGNLSRVFETLGALYPAAAAKVDRVLEPIIGAVVRSRGAAAVVMATDFATTVASEHNDRRPMCVLWKHLFLSELYDDNVDADRLMQRDGRLIEHVQYLVPAVASNALKTHRTDLVQRLMAVLLRHDRMETYQWILRSLFEYHYMLGNVRQCKEIMKHSIELNVSLTQAQQSQLINMVLHRRPKHINNEVSATIFKLMF